MDITLETIQAFEKAVQEAKAEYESMQNALKIMQRRYHAQSGDSHIPSHHSTKPAMGQMDLDEIKLPPTIERQTLGDSVQELIKRFGQQEFTVAHVEAILKEQGKAPKGKQPRARIAMTLKQLQDDGIIIRTYEGKGSDPHRYKAKQQLSVVNRS